MYGKEFFEKFQGGQTPQNFEKFKAAVIDRRVHLETLSFGSFTGKVASIDLHDQGYAMNLMVKRCWSPILVFLSQITELELT